MIKPSSRKDLYSLDSIVKAFESIKEEKGIDKLLNKVKNQIFGSEIKGEDLEDFKCFVRKFYSLYYLMKDKFFHIYRKNTGERYFEHLRGVVHNVLEFSNPNIDKILIALAHDSIEDTDIDFDFLKISIGAKNSLAVQAISKPSFKNYKFVDGAENTDKEAKKLRNDEYFKHLKSFEAMKTHIKSLALEKSVELSDEEIIEITQNTFDVKFADRIHNLSTQWNSNDLYNVKRKVEETREFFLDIAKELNSDVYDKLQSLILELEIRVLTTQKMAETLSA